MTSVVRVLRILIPTVLLLLLVTGGVLLLQRLGGTGEPLEIVLPTPTESIMVIYVSGAVANPGVYNLGEGARVEEAVERAGGFSSDADTASINLAAKLRDGMQINVLKAGELLPSPDSGAKRININTASQQELESLKGIGEEKARAIIEYREKNGPFHVPEDMLRVKGIGPSTLRNIRDLITVE